MTSTMRPVWQIAVLAVWVNLAETVRWVLYSKSRFEAVYRSFGVELPNEPVNGILWMLWGVMIAWIVYALSRRFTLLQTTLITWLAVFVSVWIALWNFALLPLGMLPVVAPLSLLTVYVAALVAQRLPPRPSA